MIDEIRNIAAVVALFFAGCTFQPTYEVTCATEGAVEDGRTCVGGVWVASEARDAGADDNTADDSTGADACTAETDDEFCARLGLTCDDVTATDNCGGSRTANCGSCTGQATCGGGGTANVCACADQTDTDFCASYQKTCDPFTAEDECGEMRTVTCGMCQGVETCSDNACTCDVTAACDQLMANCGMVDVTGTCAGTSSIMCGTCGSNATCGATNQCLCAAGFVGDGLTCADVDECMVGTHDCGANATCTNTPGSFTCACDTGYVGDGRTCTRVPQPVVKVVKGTASMPDGTTTATATIGAVTLAQSVPFATMRLDDTDDEGRAFAVDVYLTANDTLTVSRDRDTGDVTVLAYVVEFDPLDATVQTGTFTFNGTTHSEPLPTAVVPAKSFVVFYYEKSGNQANKEHIIVAADLNAAGTAIDFARENMDGNITGHWWVVESVGNAFAVQHAAGALTDVAVNIPITPVTLAKSFVLYSYMSNTNTNDAERGQARCGLLATNTVLCRRASNQDEIPDIRVQVVSLAGTQTVQATVVSPVLAGQSTAMVVLTTAVDARAMAFGGQLGLAGMTQMAGTSGTDTPGGFFTHEIVNAGLGVALVRGGPNDEDAAVAVQVVQW